MPYVEDIEELIVELTRRREEFLLKRKEPYTEALALLRQGIKERDLEIKPKPSTITAWELVIMAQLAQSQREARDFIKAGEISVDGEVVTDADAPFVRPGKYYVERGRRHEDALLWHRICVDLFPEPLNIQHS